MAKYPIIILGQVTYDAGKPADLLQESTLFRIPCKRIFGLTLHNNLKAGRKGLTSFPPRFFMPVRAKAKRSVQYVPTARPSADDGYTSLKAVWGESSHSMYRCAGLPLRPAAD